MLQDRAALSDSKGLLSMPIPCTDIGGSYLALQFDNSIHPIPPDVFSYLEDGLTNSETSYMCYDIQIIRDQHLNRTGLIFAHVDKPIPPDTLKQLRATRFRSTPVQIHYFSDVNDMTQALSRFAEMKLQDITIPTSKKARLFFLNAPSRNHVIQVLTPFYNDYEIQEIDTLQISSKTTVFRMNVSNIEKAAKVARALNQKKSFVVGFSSIFSSRNDIIFRNVQNSKSLDSKIHKLVPTCQHFDATIAPYNDIFYHFDNLDDSQMVCALLNAQNFHCSFVEPEIRQYRVSQGE